MIEDVIAETVIRAKALAPCASSDVRMASGALVGFSPAMAAGDEGVKGFLYPRMYHHSRVERIMGAAQGVVRDLFMHYAKAPDDLPAEWRDGLDAGESALALRIADYIAGMTDRYALIEHARHFKTTPELI